jgi:hypothetical protein
MESNNFEQCINNGIKKFTEFFDHKICKLIDEYPENQIKTVLNFGVVQKDFLILLNIIQIMS